MTGTLSREFARFASRPLPAPGAVLRIADRAILDTLGVMIAGGAHPATRALARALPEHPGPAALAVGGFADAESAALVNGMAAHVWDFDDTSYTGIMHGSAVILPTVMALAAERRADADAIRDAFIKGSEIAYVLAGICGHAHYFRGWWSTATFGLVGATAAAGAICGLTEDRMAAAIGLAAAAAGGGKAVFGSDAKPYLVGETARRAIGFVRMAGAGLSGPERAFEADTGFLELLNQGIAEKDHAAGLGRQWRLLEPGLLFKSNPVCSAAQAAIEQMTALIAETGAAPHQIVEIAAEIPELVYISLVHPDPRSPQEAQFSLPYALACAVLHGRVRFEDLSPEAIRTADKAALMAKVRVVRAADLSTDEMRARYPESARLMLRLSDGRMAEGFCGVAHGMPENPLSDADLIAKFDAALAYAGFGGMIDIKPGGDPAETLAGLMNPAGFSNRRRTS